MTSIPLQVLCNTSYQMREMFNITPAAEGIKDATQCKTPCTGTHMRVIQAKAKEAPTLQGWFLHLAEG